MLRAPGRRDLLDEAGDVPGHEGFLGIFAKHLGPGAGISPWARRFVGQRITVLGQVGQ